MIKQFLLTPDGSLPKNTNLEVLEQEGVLLVLPTPVPRESGMVAVEQNPEFVDGVWKQVWKLEPEQSEEMVNDESIKAE